MADEEWLHRSCPSLDARCEQVARVSARIGWSRNGPSGYRAYGDRLGTVESGPAYDWMAGPSNAQVTPMLRPAEGRGPDITAPPHASSRPYVLRDDLPRAQDPRPHWLDVPGR
jgi:hypothetical protein